MATVGWRRVALPGLALVVASGVPLKGTASAQQSAAGPCESGDYAERLSRANDAWKAGDLKRAYFCYKAAGKLQGTGEVYRGMGFVLLKGNKLDEAEQAFLKAIEVDPAISSARFGLAWVNYAQQDYERAKAWLDEEAILRSLTPSMKDLAEKIESAYSGLRAKKDAEQAKNKREAMAAGIAEEEERKRREAAQREAKLREQSFPIGSARCQLISWGGYLGSFVRRGEQGLEVDASSRETTVAVLLKCKNAGRVSTRLRESDFTLIETSTGGRHPVAPETWSTYGLEEKVEGEVVILRRFHEVPREGEVNLMLQFNVDHDVRDAEDLQLEARGAIFRLYRIPEEAPVDEQPEQPATATQSG